VHKFNCILFLKTKVFRDKETYIKSNFKNNHIKSSCLSLLLPRDSEKKRYVESIQQTFLFTIFLNFRS
jgi:hypothetical protein